MVLKEIAGATSINTNCEFMVTYFSFKTLSFWTRIANHSKKTDLRWSIVWQGYLVGVVKSAEDDQYMSGFGLVILQVLRSSSSS